MKKRDWAFPTALIVAAVVALGVYLYSSRDVYVPGPVEAPAVQAAVDDAPSPEPAEPAGGEYMVPKPADNAAPPLPSLASSDAAVTASMTELFGAEPVDTFLVPTDIIRRFVVMVDNLPERALPLNARPVRKLGGTLQTQTGPEGLTLSPDNASRYSAFVQAIRLVDAKRAVAIYFHYYPLFQTAYAELGKTVYFNDRLIAVIDHLLATPEVTGPIGLVPYNMVYRYADPQLETRSSGQKVLMRIGPENAAVIKAKLVEIRAAIVARHRSPSAP